LAVRAREEVKKKEARKVESLLEILAGGIALVTIVAILQLLLSRFFARPAPVAMPAYDYVIDIYADKVVITASDGSTTILGSVAELNSWLKGVRDKRIVVYAYTRVGDTIVLTRNTYVFVKGWYSHIALAETVELYFLGDYVDLLDNAPEGTYIDIPSSRVFIVNAGMVVLYSSGSEKTLRNMTVVCIGCKLVKMDGFGGGAVVLSNNVDGGISDSELDVLVVDSWGFGIYRTTVTSVLCLRATYADLASVTFAGDYVAVDVGMPFVRTLRPSGWADDTATITVPLIRITAGYTQTVEMEVNVYVIESGSPVEGVSLRYLAPAGDRVSYSVDPSTATITVKNNTASYIAVFVLVRLIY